MNKFVVIIGLFLCSGCYQYSQFQPTPSALGKAVRVQLTDVGTTHVASQLGPGADYLDGNLASITDSSYTISLADLGRRNGTEETWKGETISLARADVESIGVRKASGGKSAALAAALVSGAVLVARSIGAGEGAIRTRTGGPSTGQ